jgi:hypothetical protein
MKKLMIISLVFVFSCAFTSAAMACEMGCLTRTPGFWGNHPEITEMFLPEGGGVVCGYRLMDIEDVIEDLCFSNPDAAANDTSPQQLQLIRECTAAYFNRDATRYLGGNCQCDLDLNGLLGECCVDICRDGLSGPAIGETECIERLDAFNNSEDTLPLEPGDPFIRPGPADSSLCRDANGDGIVNLPRNLGPPNPE